MEKKEQQHKRRVRYKGTHPRNYKEKYKELQPEKYADTIQKVIEKGSTPAGMHISIMVKEILDFLQIQPGQTGLDATLGYGGHTSEMLKCLQAEGHIYRISGSRSSGSGIIRLSGIKIWNQWGGRLLSAAYDRISDRFRPAYGGRLSE